MKLSPTSGRKPAAWKLSFRQIDVDDGRAELLGNIPKNAGFAGTGLAHQQHQAVIQTFGGLQEL